MSEDRGRRLYELLAEKRVVRRDDPEDELEELERLEVKEMVRELKRLKLQELIERHRQRLKRHEDGGREGSASLDPRLALELSKLPEEERMKVLQVMQMLKAVERLPPEYAFMAPLVMTYAMHGNPGSNPSHSQPSLKDLAEAIKILSEVSSSRSMPSDVQSAASSILSKLVDMVTALTQQVTEERLKRIEEKASFNPLDAMKSILDIAKEIKKLGGAEAANPDALLKLKELEMKANMLMQRMQFEQQRWMQQQQLEQRKWENISKLFEGPVGKVFETLGSATADKIRGQPVQHARQRAQQQQPSSGRILKIMCSRCGNQLYVLEDQDKVACPHCGVVLQKVVEGEQQQQQGEVGSAGGGKQQPEQVGQQQK